MKIKLRDGTLLPWPNRPLSLGEQRMQKREFGVIPSRDGYDLEDPDSLAAMLYHAMRLNDPDAPARAIVAQIERIREIDLVDDDGNPFEATADDDVPDPTPAEKTGGEDEHSE